MYPEDEEGFSKFGEALKNKITVFEVSLFGIKYQDRFHCHEQSCYIIMQLSLLYKCNFLCNISTSLKFIQECLSNYLIYSRLTLYAQVSSTFVILCKLKLFFLLYFQKSKHYCSFLEKLFTDLVVSCKQTLLIYFLWLFARQQAYKLFCCQCPLYV